MEQVEKWYQVHKKACLVTGIVGLLLSPFLWPMFLAVILQSLTLGLPIAAGIYYYKHLNEKKEKTNENEQKYNYFETKAAASSEVCSDAESSGGVQKSPDETRAEPIISDKVSEQVRQEAFYWYETEGRERLETIWKKAAAMKKREITINKEGSCTVAVQNGYQRIGFWKGFSGRPRDVMVKILKKDGYTVRSSGTYLWVSRK